MQWALNNIGQTYGPEDVDIDAPEAWDYETGSPDILIGIIDTGCPIQEGKIQHPDLDNKNRYLLGKNFVRWDNDILQPVDLHGHGTHVLGIIGAETNNEIGVAGINWESKILIERAFNEHGLGTSFDFERAAIEACEKEIDILNMSGGGYRWSETREEAVRYLHDHNVLQIYPTGNDGPGDVAFPARHAYVGRLPGHGNGYSSVISVGASDYWDAHPAFSSYDPNENYVTVVAPGGDGFPYTSQDIFSTTPGYPVELNMYDYFTQEYGTCPGTSMSCAIVSGVASLVLSHWPNMTPAQVRLVIERCAEDVNSSTDPGFDKYMGYGRINAFYALAPPNPPQNLAVETGENGHPYISWDENTEPDIAGYYIFRRDENDNIVQINTIPTQQTHLLDQDLVTGFATSIFYYGKATDVTGQVSAPSNEEEVWIAPLGKKISAASGSAQPSFDCTHFPNPFNSTVTIKYQLPKATQVRLIVYDQLGHPVKTLVNAKLSAGNKTAVWDGCDFNGEPVGAGLYLYRIESGENVETRKFLILK
ncbi:MAG: S8 family serine peptidase [Candidatus Marinimicrobia bacterium]|nr:S8 family serine peptidase [Candidatus Neomarinimicrobiota bacterium]